MFVYLAESSIASLKVCGSLHLEVVDSYGDGWNGNDMDVVTRVEQHTYRRLSVVVIHLLTH